MTQLKDISSLHWQTALGGDGIVENIDDIHQAIAIILRTPQGADPLRPEFGSKLHDYIDYPIHRARPHVVRESVEAIARWEPRVTVERVSFEFGEPGQALVKVFWRLPDGFADQTAVAL